MWLRKRNPRAPVDRAGLEFYPKFEGEHPIRWDFPDYLDNPSCRWLQCLKEMYAMPIIFPASLSPEAGLLVHSLIRNLRPTVVVEIGSFLSVSTHWIAAALKANGQGGIIHCFDDFGPVPKGPWCDAEMLGGRLEWVKERLAKAGLIEQVRFYPGDSPTQVEAARPALAGGVQFAFIDGDHRVRGAVGDLRAIEPVLDTGGYMLLHDTFPEQCGGHQGPRHILDNMDTVGAGVYEKIELYLSPLNYGLGLLRRIG